MIIDLKNYLEMPVTPRSVTITTDENGDTIKLTIRLDQDQKFRLPIGRPRSDSSIPSRTVEVLRNADSPMKTKQIVQAVGEKANYVSNALSKLHQQGLVEHVSVGRWAIKTGGDQ